MVSEQTTASSHAKVSAKPATTPITQNPLFPALVALWFGALFGLGSVAIRASLLESVVLALHLDTIIPAAAPPLGFNARMALALCLAVIGAIFGAVVARRITRPKVAVKERRRGAKVSSDDVRDGAGLQRRRALAIDNDHNEFDYYESAPLPGGATPTILNVSQVDVDSLGVDDLGADRPDMNVSEDAPFIAAAGAKASQEAEEVLDLVETLDAPAKPAFAPSEDQQAANPPVAACTRAFDAPDMTAPAMPEPATMAPATMAPAVPVAEAQPQFSASEQSAGFVRPPFMAPQPSPETQSTPETHSASAGMPVTKFVPPSGEIADRLVNAELDELTSLQLIERLAVSLQRRRARIAEVTASPVAIALPPLADLPHRHDAAAVDLANPAAAETASELPQAPVPFVVPPFSAPAYTPPPFAAPDATEATEATEASVAVPVAEAVEPATTMAAPAMPPVTPPVMPLVLPAALRPIGFDHDDDDDLDAALASILPPRGFAMPQSAPAAPVAPVEATATDDAVRAEDQGAPVGEESESDVLESGYSSLLNLSRATTSSQGFVRVDEVEAADSPIEPVVVFPGQRFARESEVAAPVVPEPFGTRPFDAPGARPTVSDPATPIVPAMPGDAVPETARSVDAEESERALRAALSTLQRMSGAA